MVEELAANLGQMIAESYYRRPPSQKWWEEMRKFVKPEVYEANRRKYDPEYDPPAYRLREDTMRDPIIEDRMQHVRALCMSSIRQDRGKTGGGPCALTDRAWLAQSVLNILNGHIDDQIVDEINRADLS